MGGKGGGLRSVIFVSKCKWGDGVRLWGSGVKVTFWLEKVGEGGVGVQI